MSTLPFAAAMQRANAAVLRRLADMQGLLDGVAVQGIFSNDYANALGGMSTARPYLVVADEDAAAVTQASLFVAEDGITYRVRNPQPDGVGRTRLTLEKQ